MYWVTRGGFVVEQRGQVAHNRVSLSGNILPAAIAAHNVPTGGFRGMLRLDRLRPATAHEVSRARKRSP
ncbi:MAG TPA: hypothetical protein VFQ42_21920 [Mycobacterium sp.]|nr:hypothetical protein [Mycobacterium sp.]